MTLKSLLMPSALACAIFSSANAFNPRDYSIVPPAPEVASLMDFKDYPVDYFHGVPTISFPIYTLKSGSIEIPITLAYHGGGVRADQSVGNAGLSWSVICGATISHTVYGAPDDANRSNGVHGLYHLNSDEALFRQKLIEKVADYDPFSGTHYEKELSWISNLGMRYYYGRTDVANDLYNLSGYNMSATFVRSKNGGVTMSSDSPIKISQTTDIPTITDGGCDGWGFLVSDNTGIKYEFLTQDRTRYDYHHGSPLLTQTPDSVYYASAWHLDKVTDLCGNNVIFRYKKRDGRMFRDYGHSVARGYSNPSARELDGGGNISSVTSCVHYPQILQEVEASGVKVSFTYHHEGTSGGDALIKNITITAPDGKQRVFEFIYDQELLSEIRDGDQTIYAFEYNLEFGYARDRTYQDFGGYINANSGTLLPTVNIGDLHLGYGADRSPSSIYGSTLVLTKIKYPTGGYTDFEWENHSVKYLNSVYFSGTTNTNKQVASVHTDMLRYCVEPGFSILRLNNWILSPNQEASLDLTQYFQFESAYLYPTAYGDSHKWHKENYSDLVPPSYPHVVIRDHNTQKVVDVFFLDKETIEPTTPRVREPTRLSLPPGTYDFELRKPLDVQGEDPDWLKSNFLYGNCESGYIYINKMTMNMSNGGNKFWCGLRIKSIKSSTGDPADEPLRKHFFYGAAMDVNASNGTIQRLPEYNYKYDMVFYHPTLQGYGETEVHCVGETAFPNTTIGSFTSIEYPQVTVCMVGDNINNTDSYLYSKRETFAYSSARMHNYVDYNHSNFLSYQPIGSRMYTSLAHRRGNLLKHSVSLEAKSTDYAYNIYEIEDAPIYTTDAFVVCDFTRAPGVQPYGGYDYGIGTYSLIPYNKTIKSVHSTEQNGIDSFKKFEYFYDSYTNSLDYGLVKSTNETDAGGLDITTYYTYPTAGALRLPYPETEVTACSGTVMKAERTEYDQNTGLPLRKFNLDKTCNLSDLISADGITTSTQRENINNLTFSYRYNDKGNLIEIKYKDVVIASYIWGYNGLYPVIEVAGVDYDTLVGAATQCGLSTDQINGRKVSDDALISSVASKLRSRFADKTVSAVSYDWFYGRLHFTDGRGVDARNTFDGQGRLTSIRDFNNYLISKYDYHYATDKDDE